MTKLPPSVTIHVQKNLCHWYLWHISIISCGLRHLLTTFNQPVAVWFAHSSAVFAPVILFSFRFPSWGHVLEASDQRSNIFLRVSSISRQSCVRYLARCTAMNTREARQGSSRISVVNSPWSSVQLSAASRNLEANLDHPSPTSYFLRVQRIWQSHGPFRPLECFFAGLAAFSTWSAANHFLMWNFFGTNRERLNARRADHAESNQCFFRTLQSRRTGGWRVSWCLMCYLYFAILYT